MAGYTKNQIEHFKEQLKLLMKSHNLTARKLSKDHGRLHKKSDRTF
nr:MAG TPA: hypothetical protein [Caudoviricetes sp.]